MKSITIKIMAFCLLLALTVSMAACKNAGGDLTTRPSGQPDSTTSPDTSWSPDSMDFTVLDESGNQVKLSDFHGKPIVLNFWASWCPPCRAELPDFEAACKKYDGKVTFLMVNLTDGKRETVEVAKTFVESQGYTFPVYFDTTYEAAYKYGVSSIPQTYFIDAEGNVAAKATGKISAAQLEEGIGKIYSE